MARHKTGPKLTDAHRTLVVRAYAQYQRTEDIAKMLADDFGISIGPHNISRYNGDFTRMPKKWAELFKRTRNAFLNKLKKHIPEGNKAVRVQYYAEAARKYREVGNFQGMASMLEHIAKEVGNVHTNRREFTGKKGGPLQFEEIETMSYEQLQAELAEKLLKAGANIVPFRPKAKDSPKDSTQKAG